MNDFTREELEEIVEMMRYARKHLVEQKHNLSYQVEKKALSMMDIYYGNYKYKCDHHKHIESIVFGLVCEKCGRIPGEVKS